MLLLKTDLYKIAKIRLQNDEDVYDVIQETMLIAFKSIKKLKQVSSFKSWIITILINQSNSIYSKKKRKKVISLEDINNCQLLNSLHTDITDIDTLLDFEFICKNLKYEDKIIILLFYMERFTDKEIGRILNLKENTVKTKRARAKMAIKDIIERKKEAWIN